MPHDRIVISCMDRRLSKYLEDKYNDGETLFIRNAGASLHTLINTVKQLAITSPIKKIVIAPHTDCGAMGLVFNTIHGTTVPSPEVEKALVSRYRGQKFNDRKELENINVDLQRSVLAAFAQTIGAEVETDLVEMSKLDIPQHEGEHILTLTKPSATRYSQMISRFRDGKIGMFDSYFIQARGVRDVLPDIEIAVTALHIKDVRLLSESTEQNAQLARDMKLIAGRPWMEGARIALVKHV